MPRYSFYTYLKNENINNLSINWEIKELETVYENYSYFFLIHKKTNDIIIFDYDKSQNFISIKDQRFTTYQENKKITKLILLYYKKEDLKNVIRLNQESYDKLKKENEKSFYFTGGYDFQIKTKLNII
jgi:hypothetical protein